MNKKYAIENPTLIQRVMLKFSFSQKIYFVFTIIGIVVITLTYLLISNRLENISFAEQELRGNEYLRSMQHLYTKIAEHGVLIHREGKAEELEQLQNEIGQAFIDFKMKNEEYQKELLTTQADLGRREQADLSPDSLESQWEKITDLNADSSNPIIVKTQHRSLIDNFQSLLNYVGDTSRLNYDAEGETHYLVRPLLYILPSSRQINSEILILGQEISQTGMTPNKRYQMSALASELRLNLDEIQTNLEKALNKQMQSDRVPGSPIELMEPFNNYSQDVNALLLFLENEILENTGENSANANFDYSQLSDLSARAAQSGLILWNALSLQIHNLLQARIENLKFGSYLVIFLVLAGLGISSWIALLVMRESERFFKDVYKSVLNYSSGDLTSRAPPVFDAALEEMRLLLNVIGDIFENLVAQLQKSGVQLTTATTQIAAAAKHQEGTVFQQEATVKQILITAGEISSTAKNFAKTMNSVNEKAEDTSIMASKGQSGLSKMEETMRQMVEASGNIASKLAVLNEKAGAITGVITTITKVADQTNLLSLNAAIEAEKAGEQGKSFAVIAREIRRLADQTANATLDIERMINEMMSAVSEGVMGVDKFTEEIRSGVEHVSDVSRLFGQILERVREVAENFENINKGMQTQSLGAEQINESIMQLSEAAQQTTHSIRQFHEAIEQMTLATKAMQAAVTQVKKPDLENSPLARFHQS